MEEESRKLPIDVADIGNYGCPTNIPQHTPGHHACPACVELRKMYLCSLSASLPFEQAAEIYMKMRQVDVTPGAVRSARYITLNTIRSYRQYIGSLALFFGGMELGEITLEHLAAYQSARLNGAEPFVRYRRPHDAHPRRVRGVILPAVGKRPCPVHPEKIKQELNFLIRLMSRAGAWTKEMEEFFEHLEGGEREVQRALTPEEQTLWLDMAKTKERWNVVYWWTLVSIDTTTSTNELRGLRIGDVNLNHRAISIPWPSSKNKYRHRSISIENAQCLWALEQLLLRAREMGASDPTHYLFPFRIKERRFKRQPEYDPLRPMTVTGLKPRWDEVRTATGLKWFRMNDCRHTGATRLAEAGVNVEIIMKRMGHSNPRMREHYTHISLSAQRAWLRDPREQFLRGQPQPGWYPPPQMPVMPEPSTFYPPQRTTLFCGIPLPRR